jgi:hypothetical protein
VAYTVGSASVDIVPDFKNAQLAITAFFERQKNELRVPVKVDLDKQIDSGDLERQARTVGTRVSKAMNDEAAKQQAVADKIADQIVEGRFKSIVRAHAEALRMNAAMDREAAKAAKALLDEETKARIQADRDAAKSAADQVRALERAHTEALKFNTQLDRENARREAEQRRQDESRVAQAMRTAQRIADAERKARDQASKDFARQREIDLKLEERAFQESIKRQIRAMKLAMREADSEEKLRLKIEIDKQQAILDGRKTGGLITEAVRHEIHQNAGLIGAAIAGVLALGAPAAIGGAVALFGGIGIVAAAQNEKIRSTYKGLWAEIKAGAISDAQAIEQPLSTAAGMIGASFQRMRPLVREAFAASGPHITTFTGSILKASENALPGLVRAVQTAGPVVSGLGQLLERTGTGVGRFFTELSTHSFAAGQAAAGLGSVLEELLPTLAKLLGEGAETASVVLPVIADGFGKLNTIIQATGGLLPQVLTGFLAFRAVQGIGKIINNWGTSIAGAAAKVGPLGGALTKVGGALTSLGPAFAVAGIAMAGYGAMVARNEKQIADWTQTLMRGGAEAARLRALIAQQTLPANPNTELPHVGNSFSQALAEEFDKAEAAARRLYAAMTPLEKAQHDLDNATRNLQKGMEDENTTASELARLKAAVAAAAARQAAEEQKLERATKGVTQAMTEQADAARARVDSAYAYQKSLLDQQQSLLDVTEAQTALDKARADGDAAGIAQAELDLKEALLGVNTALSDRVRLASEVAVSKLPAAMDDDQKKILGAKAALDELNKIIAEGTVLDPDMEAYRQQLIGIVGAADGAQLRQAQLAAALREVGVAVTEIPGTASVIIDSNSPEVIEHLKALGFKVETLPDGTVKVTPATAEAQAALGNLSAELATIDTTTAVPTVNANTNPFAGKYSQSMRELKQLGEQTPTPTIRANDFAGAVIRGVQAQLNGLHDKTVTLTTIQRNLLVNQTVPGSNIRSTVGATGGAVEDLGRRGDRHRYDTGGAVKFGRGGPWDDLVDAKVSPGEHVLDFGDVVAMGGQDAVYEFRRMLHDGYGQGNAIKQMVTTGAAPRKSEPPVQSGTPRSVHLYTPDIPAAIRELKAQMHEEAALAPVW